MGAAAGLLIIKKGQLELLAVCGPQNLREDTVAPRPPSVIWRIYSVITRFSFTEKKDAGKLLTYLKTYINSLAVN